MTTSNYGTSSDWVEIWDTYGWTNYPWGDGVRGAISQYRRVRLVRKYQEADGNGFFNTKKTRILKEWKDGVRVR